MRKMDDNTHARDSCLFSIFDDTHTPQSRKCAN